MVVRGRHLHITLGGEYKGERLRGWLPSSKKEQLRAQTGHLGQEEINYVCGPSVWQIGR